MRVISFQVLKDLEFTNVALFLKDEAAAFYAAKTFSAMEINIEFVVVEKENQTIIVDSENGQIIGRFAFIEI